MKIVVLGNDLLHLFPPQSLKLEAGIEATGFRLEGSRPVTERVREKSNGKLTKE